METCQYVLRIGAFDVTDIINNTIGGIVGLMIFKAIEKLFADTLKAQKLVNIVAGSGTVIVIFLLILLKTNSLGIRYQ